MAARMTVWWLATVAIGGCLGEADRYDDLPDAAEDPAEETATAVTLPDLWIDPSFLAAEKNAIAAAREEWARYTRIPPTWRGWKIVASTPPMRNAAGYASTAEATIWIESGVHDPDIFRSVATHELGHAIGVWEHLQGRNVMGERLSYAPPIVRLTPDDVAACRRAGVCR